MTSTEKTQETALRIRDSLEKQLLEIGRLRHDLHKATEGASERIRREADVGLGIVATKMWEEALRQHLRPHLESDPVACVRALRWVQQGTSYPDLVENVRVRMLSAEYELHRDQHGSYGDDDYSHCPSDDECREALGHPDDLCDCGTCDDCTGG